MIKLTGCTTAENKKKIRLIDNLTYKGTIKTEKYLIKYIGSTGLTLKNQSKN